MAKEAIQLIAVAGLGGIVAYLAGVGRKSGPENGETLWLTTYSPEAAKPRSPGLGSALVGLLGSALKAVPKTGGTNSPILTVANKQGGLSNVLDVIGAGEGGPAGYNAYYGGIKSAHAPPKQLTKMTVGEVLAWQDSIDPLYRSEAAGKYQIMEDTLRDMVARGVVSTGETFSENTQDKLGVALMQRRGLSRYQSGEISAETFVNNLAKEWAGIPVATGKNAGRSYYDGQNGNSATIQLADILGAVRRVG